MHKRVAEVKHSSMHQSKWVAELKQDILGISLCISVLLNSSKAM